MPKALDMHSDPLHLALKYKRSAFSAGLVKGLEQVEAKEKAEKDAGLDFDPILNSQDPGDPGDSYVVGKVAHKGEAYTVELYGVFSGKKTEKPIVVPELKLEHDRWIFINFRYPNAASKPNDNLVTLIKSYLALHSRLHSLISRLWSTVRGGTGNRKLPWRHSASRISITMAASTGSR